MAVNLNNQLLAFSTAVDHHGDNMRVTLRDDRLLTDTNDVGVLSRLFRPRASAQQIEENNEVRTALLNALSDQFGGRNKIPASVLKALNGSSLCGSSDMATSDGVRVNSGRPLTARRIRAVLRQVQVELDNLALQQGSSKIEQANDGPEIRVKSEKTESLVKSEPEMTEMIEIRDPAERLTEFRKLMEPETDERIEAGLDRGNVDKDAVTLYSEAFCRELLKDLSEEDNEYSQEFWQCVCRTESKGNSRVDDAVRKFKKGLSQNTDAFGRLSRAVATYICAGTTPEELKDVTARVMADMLNKIYRTEKKETLPLDDKTILGFQSGMSKNEIAEVDSRVANVAFARSHAPKWFVAYTRRTIENLLSKNNASFMNSLLTGADQATTEMFMAALNGAYVFNKLQAVIENSVRNGLNHESVQGYAKTFVSDFFTQFCKTRARIRNTGVMGAVSPTQIQSQKGMDFAKKLQTGVVLTQGQNTCPIIGLTNAMLMTSLETAEKAKSFLVRHQEGNRSYFEFPYRDEKGNNIRAYTDEFDKEYVGNTASLSDFEKAVFVALKKANLQIIQSRHGEGEFKPGQEFEIGSVFALFGFKDPESIGNMQGDRPSKVQQCLDGAKIAAALKAGKPCVIRLPGHFVGIESVEFDKNGLPTYGYFDSSAHKSVKIGPNGNTGFQFYIGEKA